MAIATYDELQASVASWLHRSDLTDQIKDFITLAESRLNRLLSLREEEVETSMTAAPGSAYVALPTDYSAPVSMWLESWIPRRTLIFKPPAKLPYMPIVTYPTYWTVKADQIQFDRLAQEAYPLTLRYARKFALSSTNQTNCLLSGYPDAYLFGALLESAPFIRDDARLAMWQERFDRAINEIQIQEDKSKGIVTLGVDAGAQSRYGTFNIWEG